MKGRMFFEDGYIEPCEIIIDKIRDEPKQKALFILSNTSDLDGVECEDTKEYNYSYWICDGVRAGKNILKHNILTSEVIRKYASGSKQGYAWPLWIERIELINTRKFKEIIL